MSDDFIHSTVLTEDSMIMKAAQWMGDAITESFHNLVDGLLGKAKDTFTQMGNRANAYVSQGVSNISAAVTPHENVPRSQQISAPEKTPHISHDIVASAKQATQSMNGHFAVNDVSNQDFTPISTPKVGFGAVSAGMSI